MTGRCSPGGSELTLDSGYKMYYYDPFNPAEWCVNKPPANKITALIQDPIYRIPDETSPVPPARSGAVPSSDPACVAAIAVANADPFYKAMVTAAGSSIECLLKGKYDREPYQGGGSPPGLVIFQPGVYFFDAGLTVKGNLIGGYTAASPGVALVFPEDTNLFHANSGTNIYLNAGARLDASPGAQASAAIDFAGNPVQTNTVPPVIMTVMVRPDLGCEGPGRVISLPIPAGCTMPEGKRAAIQLTGRASLYLAGVQYGPHRQHEH